jgi:hypothetical protein
MNDFTLAGFGAGAIAAAGAGAGGASPSSIFGGGVTPFEHAASAKDATIAMNVALRNVGERSMGASPVYQERILDRLPARFNRQALPPQPAGRW